MKIKVTKKHIQAGVMSCPDRCPLALAIKEATGLKVLVDLGGKIHFPDARVSLRGNAELGKFVARFDNSFPVKPFQFNIKKLRAYKRYFGRSLE